MKSLVPTVLCVILATGGNLCLKAAMMKTGKLTLSHSSILSEILRIAKEPAIIFGLCLYGVSMLLWLKIIAVEELSRVYPIFVSLAFIVIVVASRLLFKEALSFKRIVGITVICAGIYMVVRS